MVKIAITMGRNFVTNIYQNLIKITILLAFILLSACNNKIVNLHGKTMGTRYHIVYVEQGKNNISQHLIDGRLMAINRVFSSWNTGSEVAKLNRNTSTLWIDVSSELFYLLSISKMLYEQTDGYFDIGLGRLSDLWGFYESTASIQLNSRENKVFLKPNAKSIAKAHGVSGINYLDLDILRVKKNRDIHLDFSAIAKGYALDEIAKLLDAHGIYNFLIEIGGEVLARGSHSNGDDWHIGIEKPDHSNPTVINLDDHAIATSGNYRNFIIYNGEEYSHIFNPKTALPAEHKLLSVSVIHKSAMMADAYATAMMAMGKMRAFDLAKRLELRAIFITKTTNNLLKIEHVNFTQSRGGSTHYNKNYRNHYQTLVSRKTA